MKTLITGGCSFTRGGGPDGVPWPTYLSKELSLRLENTAQGGIGNRAIARRTIHAVEKELSQPKVKHSDILVGICWSSSARSSCGLQSSVVQCGFFSDGNWTDLRIKIEFGNDNTCSISNSMCIARDDPG